MRMRSSLLAAVIVTAAPGLAAAQKFEFGKAEEVEKVKDVEWTAAAEAGLVFTTGNSETTTLSAGAKASRKTGNNKLALEASLTYARSSVRAIDDQDGNGVIDNEDEIAETSTTTAETVAGKIRYDRFITKGSSLFGAVLASRDLPAGKELVLGAQLGFSRQLYKSKRHEAVAELGYDLTREDLVSGEAVAIHSARGFLGYKGELATGATLDTSVELLSNLLEVDLPTGKDGGFGQDTRVNARVAISAKIGKNLAVQTSIELKYDHRPAPLKIDNLAMGFVPEASALDTLMKASLIYTFF